MWRCSPPGGVPASTEFIDCVAAALADLTFPCFADLEVAHDYSFILE